VLPPVGDAVVAEHEEALARQPHEGLDLPLARPTMFEWSPLRH
jgi:hypothetical protein